jgi:hypothetical protein
MTQSQNSLFLSKSHFKLFLYLLFAWSLAVTQPLMSLLGEQPVFFIAHEIRGWSLIFITLGFSFIPPIILYIILSTIGFVSFKLKEWLTRVVLFILLFFFVLPFINHLQREIVYLLAIVSSFLMVFLLTKLEIFKTFALWFAPASLAFIVMFLFFSPTKQLLPKKIEKNQSIQSNAQGPVFIFVLDEFPLLSLLNSEGNIDASRFPTFANLAEDATWYPNAKAISSATSIVLPALLSGISPKNNSSVGTFEQYPSNLFTLFSTTHTLHVIENATNMCPSYLCKSRLLNPYELLIEDVFVNFQYLVYPHEMRDKLPAINNRWIGYLRELKNEKNNGYNFSERLNKFYTFIDDFKYYPENTLHFLHVLLPHAPWVVLPDLKLYGFYENDGVPGEIATGDPQAKFPHQWHDDAWATELSWRRHLLQIGAMDTMVAKSIEEIKKLGVYNEATIIIVADHGAAFIPDKSRRFAHDNNIPDIASVPLFIKYPNQNTGKIDKRKASNLDILPTLTDLFTINSFENKMDGLSLLSIDKRKDELLIIQESGEKTKIPKDYQDEFNQRLKEKTQAFPGQGWNGVFHPQSSLNFYNIDINLLKIRAKLPNSINLQNANLFSSFVNDSQYIPVYYRLNTLIENKEIKEVLVAINGTIVSRCLTFLHSTNECAGLIDPKIYSELENNENLNFRFFITIDDEDNFIVDELLINTVESALLKSTKNNESIVFNSGRSIKVNTEGAPYGNTSLHLFQNDSIYLIDGWAADTMDGSVAEKIYVFIDNELFTTTVPGIPKNFLQTKYGYKSIIQAGFRVSIPVAQFPELKNHKIRTFAELKDGSLTELFHVAITDDDMNEAFQLQIKRKIPVNSKAILNSKIEKMSTEKQKHIESIDAFNEDFKLFSTGDWYPIAKHKRWTGANLYIVAPVSDSIKTMRLLFKAKPLTSEGIIDSQRINIYLNDVLTESLKITEWASHNFEFKIENKPTNNLITIRFEMPDAIAPSSFRKSNDNRKLSLYFSEFTINIDK